MDTVLTPLYFLVSWIMIGWHWVFAELFGIPYPGAYWSLSIIGLVVVIRIMLIPLFVRQIKAQRNMQMLQPKVREIQKKYKGDRERLQQETMKLYKETGTNPFASCLPIILQAPFLFALFRVLDGIAKDIPRGAFTTHPAMFESAGAATIFGAPLSASFLDAPNVQTKIIAIVMVVLMTLTTFLTQRQIMRKNMPKEALEGPFAQQQKILLYVLPLVFADFRGVLPARRRPLLAHVQYLDHESAVLRDPKNAGTGHTGGRGPPAAAGGKGAPSGGSRPGQRGGGTGSSSSAGTSTAQTEHPVPTTKQRTAEQEEEMIQLAWPGRSSRHSARSSR